MQIIHGRNQVLVSTFLLSTVAVKIAMLVAGKFCMLNTAVERPRKKHNKSKFDMKQHFTLMGDKKKTYLEDIFTVDMTKTLKC